LGDDFSRENTHVTSLADHWIADKASQAIHDVSQLIEEYRFSEAYDRVYHFVWDELADWYIEASKVAPNKQLLATLLETILKLAHPFAPFVTETIWQTLGWTGDSLLITEPWPTAVSFDAKRAVEFEEVQKIVNEIRYITTALEVKGASFYFTKNSFLSENADLIKRLAKTHYAKEVTDGHGMHLTSTKLDCWLDIDLATAERYVIKLKVNKLEKEASIERLNARLNNKSYTDKAPTHVVQQTKEQLNEEQQLLEKIEKEIATFSAAK
jgi:valyl-tRNA synthetase